MDATAFVPSPPLLFITLFQILIIVVDAVRTTIG
jgi:hypothetical protein